MGCGSSTERNPQPARRAVNIGPPEEPMLHVPRPRIDQAGNVVIPQEHDLSAQDIQQALGLAARYMSSKGGQATIIAVGGAVNTLFLGTRQSTHDVDFFGTNLNNHQRRLLSEAAQYAESHSPAQLGGKWLNTETQQWLGPGVHRQLTDAAIQQNHVVFEAPGLKVVAAPWSYAFCTKVNRLMKYLHKPYDMTDAVSYLHQYIRTRNDDRPVSSRTIREWSSLFSIQLDRIVLRNANQEYRRRYGTDGIVK